MSSVHASTIWFRAVIACCRTAGIILAGRDTESDSWKCVLWMKYVRHSSAIVWLNKMDGVTLDYLKLHTALRIFLPAESSCTCGLHTWPILSSLKNHSPHLSLVTRPGNDMDKMK